MMLQFIKNILKKNVVIKNYLIEKARQTQKKEIEIVAYNEFEQFKATMITPRFEMSWGNRYLFMEDRTKDMDFDRHYIYHTAWAARILRETRPIKHTDISSSLYFSAIVSAFLPIEHYDFRIPKIVLENLEVGQADLTNLPFGKDSIHSLSCMHTVEHIGLGRYGDKLDYDGDLKAIKELKRVLAIGGQLLFVVPIANEPKILFNGQRIYSYEQIIDYFKDLTLMEFTLIPEKGLPMQKNPLRKFLEKENYACGCFWFKKNE